MKNREKIIRIGVSVLTIVLLTTAGIVHYLVNMPHREVGASQSDYQLSTSSLVLEHLNNYQEANNKYLDEEGESKIPEISGTVISISEDFNKQKVILLKSSEDKAGVSCTLPGRKTSPLDRIRKGQTIHVRGVIRSGATYDEDLERY